MDLASRRSYKEASLFVRSKSDYTMEWISLDCSAKQATLADSNLFDIFRLESAAPSEKHPSLVCVAGPRKKTLLGHSRSTSTLLDIHTKPGSNRYIVESHWNLGDDPLKPTSSSLHSRKHEIQTHTLAWTVNHRPQPIIGELHRRLVFPFCQSVCFIFDRMEESEALALELLRWFNAPRATLNEPSLPDLSIVFLDCDSGKAGPYFMQKTQSSSLDELQGRLSHIFRSVSILGQTTDRATILEARESDISLQHLGAFFRRATAHFSNTIVEPFDFARASRLCRPVSPSFLQHVERLLFQADLNLDVHGFPVSIISSCIMMDAYPPGMFS